MKYTLRYFAFFGICISAISCKEESTGHDATGTFESTEIIVSSEANGKVLSFPIEEGTDLTAGQEVATIDNSTLELQKLQVLSTVEAISQKQNDPSPQIEVYQQQLKSIDSDVLTLTTQLSVLEKEHARVTKLFQAEAATAKQMDDIKGQVDILKKQIDAASTKKEVVKAQIKSAADAVKIQNRGIGSERKPLEKQADIIDHQITKTKVINPINGTMLTKYVNEGEFVTIGKPMYKLADLSEMILRGYITGAQLPTVKMGQTVQVFIDDLNGDFKEYPGTISWIADKAEFTPKTIQTKDERSNLVYAIKVKVKNDGYLKIGMYGEIDLRQSVATE